MPRRAGGYALVLLAAIMFGSYGVWTRIVGDHFEPFAQGWIRALISSAILLPIALYKRAFLRVLPEDRVAMGIYLATQVGTLAPLYYALNHLNIGTATLIFYSTYVITTYLVAALLLNEHIGLEKWVSLALAIVGLVLIFGFPTGRFTVLGGLMAVVNGICSGTEVSITKLLSHRHSVLQLTSMAWLSSLLLTFVLSIAIGEHQTPLAFNHQWLGLLAFTAAGLIAFACAVEGYKYVDATIGGIVGLFEIVVAVGLGIAFYNEKLSLAIVLGMLAILASAVIPELVVHIKRDRTATN